MSLLTFGFAELLDIASLIPIYDIYIDGMKSVGFEEDVDEFCLSVCMEMLSLITKKPFYFDR